MNKDQKKKNPTPVDELSTPHRQVLSLIPVGKDNAITINQLASILGLPYHGIKDIVRDLILNHGFKIGTSNSYGKEGYFLIGNENERNATLKNFRSRMKHLYKRYKAIKNGPLSF